MILGNKQTNKNTTGPHALFVPSLQMDEGPGRDASICIIGFLMYTPSRYQKTKQNNSVPDKLNGTSYKTEKRLPRGAVGTRYRALQYSSDRKIMKLRCTLYFPKIKSMRLTSRVTLKWNGSTVHASPNLPENGSVHSDKCLSKQVIIIPPPSSG